MKDPIAWYHIEYCNIMRGRELSSVKCTANGLVNQVVGGHKRSF